MKIETVKITTTTVHELSVEGAEPITKQYAESITFTPIRARVTTVTGGKVQSVEVFGPRLLKSGKPGADVRSERYGSYDIKSGSAPAWVLEIAATLGTEAL